MCTRLIISEKCRTHPRLGSTERDHTEVLFSMENRKFIKEESSKHSIVIVYNFLNRIASPQVFRFISIHFLRRIMFTNGPCVVVNLGKQGRQSFGKQVFIPHGYDQYLYNSTNKPCFSVVYRKKKAFYSF